MKTTTSATVLVVDDDDAHRGMLRMMLKSWGYTVVEAADGDEAVEAVRKDSFDAVLTDVRMGRTDGISAMKQILSYNPSLPVILMTAYSSVETAVDALRVGAYDYLIKPLDFDALKDTLKKAMAHARLGVENRELRRQLSEENSSPEILGRSPAITSMLAMIQTVAPTEATVLVTGESGTGKELVARALHAQSLRKDAPLITVNCAALAETLLESELFGHEKGAFTGADRHREGRFKQADKGTLFLDEIGEMPFSVQAKLLRALQQGEIQRVGSDKSEHVDVRVIAATNRDLKKEVEERRFREDLYFRLNVISFEVPPLRQRREDIPLLAAHFLARFSARNRKTIKGFSPQCMDMLLHYDWPGNVRELENAVERAVILCTGDTVLGPELPMTISRLSEQDLSRPAEMPSSLAGLPLEEVERLAIEETLRETGDNKSAAARKLGITRATLHKKLRKYEIDSREDGE
ncbi:MAG: sigma-54 dependent transcriptional regulator [Desulfovibrionaceae bacterium]|nr:sigma-54 dependent transcriptional regulator [Desulfovibrionaceae bacterium]